MYILNVVECNVKFKALVTLIIITKDHPYKDVEIYSDSTIGKSKKPRLKMLL